MAVLVTVLLGDQSRHRPATFTAAVLRPGMFRITVETPPPATGTAPGGGSLPAAWSLAAGGGEP